MAMAEFKPLHIVQVGNDDSVFIPDAPSDTLARQVSYGQELARQCPGSRLTLLSLTRCGTARMFEQANVSFIPVHAGRRFQTWSLFRQLIKLHRRHSIDLLSTQTIFEEGWVGLLFGAIYRVPVIGQIHFDIFSPVAQLELAERGWLRHIRYRLGRRLIKRYQALRVVGRRIGDQLIATGWHQNVHVIPVPVTMSLYSGVTSPASTPQSLPRVLFVGRLVPTKNLTTWLKVAALVAAHEPTVQFEIVGDGPLRSGLEEVAHQLIPDGRVHFHGALAYDQLPPVYRSATVFLITSHYEGFGRVVLESYLYGVPVVGTRITGVEDIIEEGQTGFLHDNQDVQGLAMSVLRLLRDETQRQRMGQAGYNLVRSRFAPQELTRRWINLLVTTARI